MSTLQSSGMRLDQVRQRGELERENERLKRLVAKRALHFVTAWSTIKKSA